MKSRDVKNIDKLSNMSQTLWSESAYGKCHMCHKKQACIAGALYNSQYTIFDLTLLCCCTLELEGWVDLMGVHEQTIFPVESYFPISDELVSYTIPLPFLSQNYLLLIKISLLYFKCNVILKLLELLRTRNLIKGKTC